MFILHSQYHGIEVFFLQYCSPSLMIVIVLTFTAFSVFVHTHTHIYGRNGNEITLGEESVPSISTAIRFDTCFWASSLEFLYL